MDCLACRGACCESFSLPVSDLRPPNGDAFRWIELHATTDGRHLTFETPCTKLTPEGRCGIYEARPLVCRFFAPGGADCLATVRARRTPEEYQRIRGPEDPETIHEARP